MLDVETKIFRDRILAWWWWHMPLTLALKSKRQADRSSHIQGQDGLKVSFRTARTVTQRNPVSKKKRILSTYLVGHSRYLLAFIQFSTTMFAP